GIPSGAGAAAGGSYRLEPRGGVAERATADENHVVQTLFLDRLEKAGSLDRLKNHPDPDRSEVIGDRFRDRRVEHVREERPPVEAIGVPGLGQKPLRSRWIVLVERRRPGEVECPGNDARGDTRQPQWLRLVEPWS